MQLLNASQIKFAAPLQRLWGNRSKLNKLPRKWFNYVSVPERVLLPNTDNYGTELRPQIDMEDTIRIFIMFIVSDGDFCQTLAVPYFKRSVWWCYTSHARRSNIPIRSKWKNSGMKKWPILWWDEITILLCCVLFTNESITITAYSGLEATYCNNSLNEHDNCRHP